MATFTLTTGADNFSGAGADADVFSGPGGGVDTLNGGAGNDDFTIDGEQIGVIVGGSGADQVFMAAGENQLNQNLAFTTAEELIASTTNIYITVDQLAAFSKLTAGAGGMNFYVFAQGDEGGVINFATKFTTVGITLNFEGALLDEAIRVTGTARGDSLLATNFNDTIDGGAGADTIYGLGGDDLIYVDKSGAAGDQVNESLNGGFDTVAARGNFTLGAGSYIEILKTTSNAGTSAINLGGNEFSQTVIGNAGANIIWGRGGNDVLTGLGGADTFVFDRALVNNVDLISDFVHLTDKIQLDDDVFTALAVGALAASAFKEITAGVIDANDRILYNKATGDLIYDADGSGAGLGQQFVTLTTSPDNLSAADFVVVA